MAPGAPHRRAASPTTLGGILESILPGGPGKAGRSIRNNRRFVNAVFRVPGVGALWRDLPPDYGDGCATHRRSSRRSADGTRAKLLDAASDEPDPDGG